MATIFFIFFYFTDKDKLFCGDHQQKNKEKRKMKQIQARLLPQGVSPGIVAAKRNALKMISSAAVGQTGTDKESLA